MKIFIKIICTLLLFQSVCYPHDRLYLVRVSKDVSESSILKKVKSDETHNYYEVSEDELKIINESRNYYRVNRFKKPANKKFQDKLNSQFGISD